MRWTVNFVNRNRGLVLGLGLGLVMGLVLPEAGTLAHAQRSASALYEDARAAEKRLQGSSALRAAKAQWAAVANKYHRVVLVHPRSGYCDDALYYEAQIYLEMDRRFDDRAALQRAMDAYLLLANGYPASKWARKARLTRGKLFRERFSDRRSASIELHKVVSTWPSSSEGAEAKRVLERMQRPARTASSSPSSSGPVLVQNVRHWTGKDYTRIVIDIDDEVKYRQNRLEEPDRIYFDLLGTRVSKALASNTFPIQNGFLQRIRVGQNRPDVVRVVLDFQDIAEYNVFTLPDPYRLVVDILGTKSRSEAPVAARNETSPAEEGSSSETPEGEAGEAVVAADTDADSGPDPERASSEVAADLRLPPAPTPEGYSLARQLGLVPQRVIIDAGHGGHDPGTMGHRGLKEKDLALDISRRVMKLLERDGFEVLMTRERDVFVPLEERTAIANSKSADLFVSIHANAARSSVARGVETYYLNLATTPDAEEVAARENAVSTRRIGELQSLLQKVIDNSRIAESRELATHMQNALASDLFSSKNDSRNRGVKTAPLYVLLGAQMPSVLIEVAFLSNRQEEALLNDSAYRQKLARSVAQGIRSYHSTLVRTTNASVASQP